VVERPSVLGPIRKAIVLCLAAVPLMATLAGCGGSSDNAGQAAPQTPAGQTPTPFPSPVPGCVAAATDGHGGPYPAAVSSDCRGHKSVEVDIVNDPKMVGGFSPSNVTISPGTVVEFVWKSSGHNLSPFHTEIEDTGFIYRKTFDHAGVYTYSCQVHPGQNGVVFVR
jgi:plastocyanin